MANIGKSKRSDRVEARLDQLHNRIQAKLDELHTDFQQLQSDLHLADQESARARKDRIQGFKQALKDLMNAADKADREWT